jgi:adenylate cyclase class 2
MNSDAPGENLEIEVKFLIFDLGELKDRLLGLDAILISPRTFEQNIIYDNAWQGLARQAKLLRLRQDAAVRLTFKGASDRQLLSEARVREEIEVTVDDYGRMMAILERIGFEKVHIYEKYRETFSFRQVEVVLDQMPFGDFVELEGSESGIREAADILDLRWERRIVANYLSLFARVKSRCELPFDDITFDNFDAYDISNTASILEEMA